MRRALAPALLLLLTTACGEEAEVRVTTRVFPDASLQREVRVDARVPDREEPYPKDWLRSGPGLALAAPEAWDRVEELPAGLRAEGFFAPGEKVPPILAHRGEIEGTDRGQVEVARDDLVVLDLFTFREIMGDPFGPEAMASALDALLESLAGALSQDLRRQFGEEIATARVEAFLRKDVRATLLDLLTALRETEAPGRRPARAGRLAEVHARHRLPGVLADDPDAALAAGVRALIDRVAAEVVRANPRLSAPALTAFVGGEDGAIARLLDDPTVSPSVEALQGAFFGAYGLGARVRFVSRVEMPGRVLRTNGTVDGEGVVFTFDQDALSAADVSLQVESVELDDEALRQLGARRDLDAASLLRAVDLLTREDVAGPLRGALHAAVERKSLAPLREEGTSDPLKQAARELADLLDPDASWPPA